MHPRAAPMREQPSASRDRNSIHRRPVRLNPFCTGNHLQACDTRHGIIASMSATPTSTPDSGSPDSGTTASGRVVLLRHGQTEWATSGRHTGTTDVPLTDVGERQAAAAGELVGELGLRDPLIVSSPRTRALRTAQLAGLTVEREWDALSEWDYGDYEGKTSAEIQRTVPHWTVWTHPCPGGESVEQVGARADLVLSVILPALGERDVVLVGHGHFSRALLTRWLELPVSEGKRFALSPAAYSVLGFEHSFRQVVVHNIHPSVRTGVAS